MVASTVAVVVADTGCTVAVAAGIADTLMMAEALIVVVRRVAVVVVA